MAIRTYVQRGIFEQPDVLILSAAFEEAVRIVQIDDRKSPLAEVVAARIIDLFENGESDPMRLARIATGQMTLGLQSHPC